MTSWITERKWRIWMWSDWQKPGFPSAATKRPMENRVKLLKSHLFYCDLKTVSEPCGDRRIWRAIWGIINPMHARVCVPFSAAVVQRSIRDFQVERVVWKNRVPAREPSLAQLVLEDQNRRRPVNRSRLGHRQLFVLGGLRRETTLQTNFNDHLMF